MKIYLLLLLLLNEVRAALKKMKRHKAPGLSGLVTEMIQALSHIHI